MKNYGMDIRFSENNEIIRCAQIWDAVKENKSRPSGSLFCVQNIVIDTVRDEKYNNNNINNNNNFISRG